MKPKFLIFASLLITLVSFSFYSCSSENDENVIEKKIDAKKLASILKLQLNKAKENQNLNNSFQMRGTGLTETDAQEFLEPFVSETRNLLLQEGITQAEIIHEFGSLDAPEIALVGISIIEMEEDNYQMQVQGGPSVLDCVARAFVGFELHEGFWNQFSNRRLLIRAIGKVATRYLGAVGAALIVYDFGDCMGWF
jgi:hypothetical protein